MMSLYLVNHRYACESAGHQLSLAAGSTVELTDTQAEFVERDSPGCLSPASELGKADAGDAREVAAPPSDRAQKRRRRDREGDPSDEGSMSRSDHPGLVR